MKILGTICARGGSKGVRNKNIRHLSGKPLIAYTIEYFKSWGKANRIVCSTDSKKIAEIAEKFGAEIPFIRPKNLATDAAPKLAVLQHLLNYCENQDKTKYDVIVDLDPTSPIRKKINLEQAFELFIKNKDKINNLFSGCKARKNPYFNMVEIDENGYAKLCKESKIIRRQDAKNVYELNASIYIYNRDFLLNTKTPHSNNTLLYEMPEISSFDIDRELDFKIIEFLIENEVFKFDY